MIGKQKLPAYIVFVGDTNPKQKVDVRGLRLVEDEGEYVVQYDEESDFLYCESDGRKIPVTFDYSR